MDSDPDPDPAIFIIGLQDASKKLIFNTIFSAYYFLKVHLHHFSKIKSQKESQISRNQGFSYYFCMIIEGSGSGSIPLTSGSGSGRPKNMWSRWIRIRNTGSLKSKRAWIQVLLRNKQDLDRHQELNVHLEHWLRLHTLHLPLFILAS
jgi:hypothetical protein